MTQDKDSIDKSLVLRTRAEETLGRKPSELEDISALSPDEIQRLVHELRVHQIELEMQNEDLRQAQIKLEKSKDRYLDLYDFAPVGYLTVNEKGLILEANLTAVRLLGVEREGLIKTPFSHFVCKESGDAYYLYLQQIFETRSMQTCEIKLVREDGTDFYAQMESVVVQDENGQFNRCRTVVSDITERKRLEDELNRYRTHLEDVVKERTEELYKRTRELETANVRLREADRLKTIFLASMSHELRTPLNSIIGFTGIMLMGLTGELSEEQKKQLNMVKDSANHLLGLLEEVLDIAKIEAGGVTLSLENFEIGEMIDSVIETVAPVAAEKGLEIVRQVPSGLALTSDKRRVKQILMNIIGNAVKFTEHGNLKITAGVLGDGSLELSFTDTGIGIKEEDMKRLFSPFQQTDATLTKAYDGSGLGLYLSKKLATLLGGDISVTSTHGKGSEFTVVLPLVSGGAHEKDTGG